jgi:penicillin-binding protein 1A
MSYAHQGIELKNHYGVDEVAPTNVAGVGITTKSGDLGAPQRPATLSRRSNDVIFGIEETIRAAGTRKRADTSGPTRGAITVIAGDGASRSGSARAIE